MRHIEILFRPLESYPGVKSSTRSSPFKANYRQTLMLLDDELRHLDARNCVLSIDIAPEHWRRDGMPREDKAAKSPAVVLSFETKKLGAIQYPCCSFTAWRDNVRAIALALEALRKIDRYGVTSNGEQYRGWQRLEGPAPGQTPQQAASVIVIHWAGGSVNDVLNSKDTYLRAVKQARVNTHPDRRGDDQAFKAVQAAAEILDRYHGV
jgi:hypothetical protein